MTSIEYFLHKIELQNLSDKEIDSLIGLVQSLDESQFSRLIDLARCKLFIASGKINLISFANGIMEESIDICVPIFAENLREAQDKLIKYYKDEGDSYIHEFENVAFTESI